MTKKLFLAAASVAALAFAGAATAGDISGAFGGTTFTDETPYTVASELIVSSTAKATGFFEATNTLKNAIKLSNGVSRDYLVSFDVTGAALDAASLDLAADYVPANGTFGSSLVSSENGVVTFLVTLKGTSATDLSVTAFTLEANVSQSAQASITVSGKVVALIGGSQIPVDTAAVVTAAEYAPVFTALKATPVTVTAALADYKKFLGGALTANLGVAKSAVTGTTFHSDLDGTTVTAADILADGGLLTITGPLINEHFTAVVPGTVVATEAANTAIFDLSDVQAAAFVTGNAASVVKLTQTGTAADQQTIQAGSYTVSWAPKVDSLFRAPAPSSAVVGTVALEGTNFTAPWVSGTGAATSVVRLSNNTTKASGVVTIRLKNATKVTGGVAAPFVTTAAPFVVGTVPAGSDLQITSAQLAAHFGEFTRADLQITINSAAGAITAKMRNTRDGVTFEQSLAN